MVKTAAQHRRTVHQQAKQFRAVATHYDNRDYMYRASVDIATMKIWLRDLT